MSDRVLVVDDHHAWREKVRSILRQSGRWQTAGEAADGRAAVETAQLLQPDVIVLDVTLPVLNGLEAAARILARRPDTKILFVSLHRSFDIVEAALATGAHGYVLKANPAELLPALEAIAAGKHYLCAALTARHGPDTRSHEIAFDDDGVLLAQYARFGGAALRAGKALIFAGAEPRRRHLRRALQMAGVDLDRAIRDGQFVELDVAEMLSQLLVRGRVDEGRFWKTGTALFLSAAKASTRTRAGVAACGDGCATLLADGNIDAAIRLEQLWDEFAGTFNVEVFCGYPERFQADEAHRDVVRQICEAHSAVRCR